MPQYVLFGFGFGMALVWTYFVIKIANDERRPKKRPNLPKCEHEWEVLERYADGTRKRRCLNCHRTELVTGPAPTAGH